MVIKGEVIRGLSLGRKLGFPTANIALGDQFDIENGVYLSSVVLDGKKYNAISNIGVKPTIGEVVARGLECHIIDFAGDLYGESIEVELLEKMRDEMRFESVEALKRQVELDIEHVKKLKINI
ncbi:MAG: riboflavin kinase [Rikenellaceae bacterium]